MQPLDRSFFARPTLSVARDTLGKYLIFADKIVQITEVEAYIGTEDPASHAFHGLTPRTQVMFGPPGHAYIYLIYGMYHCLNFVTETKDFPAAVLIRAARPVSGLPVPTDLSGPGKLTRELGITRTLNGLDTCLPHSPLFLTESHQKPTRIIADSRIGIKNGREHLWRFTAVDFLPLT